jgi:hypothetical protein
LQLIIIIIIINLNGSGNNQVEKTLQYLEGLREAVFYLEVLYGREQQTGLEPFEI